MSEINLGYVQTVNAISFSNQTWKTERPALWFASDQICFLGPDVTDISAWVAKGTTWASARNCAGDTTFQHGSMINHFTLQASRCQVTEQVVYFSVTQQTVVFCVAFQTTLLTATWFLLGRSDWLPALWIWRCCRESRYEWQGRHFEIQEERPEHPDFQKSNLNHISNHLHMWFGCNLLKAHFIWITAVQTS